MQTESHQSSSDAELTPNVDNSAPLTVDRSASISTEGIKHDATVSAHDHKELEIKLKFGEETHQYVRDYIRLADQKAAFFFAGSAAFLAYLNTLGLTNNWISNPSSWGLIHILSFIATTCLIVGSLFCIGTVMPRLGGASRGIIFFHAICQYESSSEYSEDVLSRKLSQLCDAKYKHTYELSSVCRAKYSSLIYGFKFGIVGVIAAFILLSLR